MTKGVYKSMSGNKFQVAPAEYLTPLKPPLKEVILVDFSWVLHKSCHTYQNLSVVIGGIPVMTGDFYGSLYNIASIVRRKPFSAVIICLDSQDTDKSRILPEYKGTRDSHREVYRKMYEIVHTAGLLPNVYVCAAPAKEADEVIFSLSQTLVQSVQQVLIYANDQDLFQCFTDPRIRMFKQMNQNGFEEYGAEYAKEKFGVAPDRIPFLRSICGSDSSDNLKAYARFPKDLAREIVDMYQNPEEFLRGDFSASTPARQRWVQVLRDQPDRMIKLYSIHRNEIIPGLRVLKVVEPSWEYVIKYQCKSIDNSFKSLIREAVSGNNS